MLSDLKWGDWRPHLAMMLSNKSTRPEVDKKHIITLGDTLGNFILCIPDDDFMNIYLLILYF